MQTFYIPKYNDISQSFDISVRSILTISNDLLCYYILELKILKHQKFSLNIIFSWLVLIIEYFFEKFVKDDNIKTFFIVLFLLILNYIYY